MRARYFDPYIGRFISEDSYTGKDNDPLSLNLYTYCNNDPANFYDPTGHTLSQWDRDNLSAWAQVKMLYYTAAYREAQAQLLFPWMDSGSARENLLAYMNYYHKKAYELRKERDKSQEDTYDYTYGGTYSGFTPPDSLMKNDTLNAIAFATGGLSNAGIKTVTFVSEEAGTIRVIGHFPEYVTKAEELGVKYFSIPKKIWDAMSETERWTANVKFLDRAIEKGAEFILATPMDKIKAGSYLEKEINYLLSKGYELAKDGTKLIKSITE